MPTTRKAAVRAIRRVAGDDSRLEQRIRHTANRVRLASRGEFRRRDVHVFRSGRGERRFGMYAFGACDLWTVVYAGELLKRHVAGTGCVLKLGTAASARSDVLLQTLEDGVRSAAEALGTRFSLPDGYFEPRLFEPAFTVPGHEHLGAFPKDVVVLSTAPDLTRVVYGQRDGGLLVDPGGWWLEQPLDEVLGRLGDARWFARNFRKLGRLDVTAFKAGMGRLVGEVRARTGAAVLVLNSLTIEPGRPTPDYRLVANPQDRRRREFDIALAELSAEQDFSIVDVDRVLKGVGTAAQADFIHFTPPQKRAIAAEIVRVLCEREVVGGTAVP